MALRPDQRVASWIVATHYRPALMRAALDSILACKMPEGWGIEIIVVRHDRDRDAERVLADCDVVMDLVTTAQTCAKKRNLALSNASGHLLLVADDDDIQSPIRALEACAAYEDGHLLSSVREFRQLHLSTGDVVRWTGVKDASGPMTGRARNYDAAAVRKVGGWDESVARGIDSELTGRLYRRLGIREHDLGTGQARRFVCIQHQSNVWARPVVSKDRRHRHGGYILTGEGHWTTCEDFPVAYVKDLFIAAPETFGHP